MDLLPTYIQKGSDSKKDLYATWGILLKTAKLINVPKLKEPSKRSWLDEQGDDEYLPENPTFQAYTTDIEFAYIGDKDTFQKKLKSFWSYLQGTEFNLFDVYYKAGIRCRYDSYDETFKQRRGSDIFLFTMTFKVNQPLCTGFYVPEESFSDTANVSGTIYYSDGLTQQLSPGVLTHSFHSTNNFIIVVPDRPGDIFTNHG